ncbi:cytochrome b/b6 domain-containing protein [Albimonas pacifica]|uniref:Cytochrome b n=1 Tax=Albimonas pacifica TaxID=1114924 RepID=A0A1I3IY89_9RHOB|nr:cytochrome b/b6 domain-containing protein [Albimonas pacifica]SFI52825.1 Cytochrome b [Albimonas pacifica]
MNQTPQSEAAPVGPRWDLLVRIVHWSIAAAVVVDGLILTDGGLAHIWIGYAAGALLALRLVWGLVGSESARFAAFPPSLSAAREHAAGLFSGRPRRPHRSHNPLGALMVYALWATLAVVIATGVAMTGSPLAPRMVEAEPARSLLGLDDDDAGQAERDAHEDEEEEDDGEEGALEEVHEAAANLLLLLALLHVGGVALESRLSGRNLARDMITGGGD